MTGSVICTQDLVSDPEFVGFCHCWERDRRCPLSLPDWLRERGLERQADVAEWAVAEPNRPDPQYRRQRESGPTPYRHTELGYGWWRRSRGFTTNDCDDLVWERSDKIKDGWGYASFAAAVAALLNHYEVPND